jgi:hypothetical protein
MDWADPRQDPLVLGDLQRPPRLLESLYQATIVSMSGWCTSPGAWCT